MSPLRGLIIFVSSFFYNNFTPSELIKKEIKSRRDDIIIIPSSIITKETPKE